MTENTSIVPIERIETRILLLRGRKIMPDSDLASPYGVATKVLVQAVKRHLDRFPKDFMFQLSGNEFRHLRSQSVTSSRWGGRRYPPYAFTEQGVAMLSSVLGSRRAIRVNIEIMRAFVRLRHVLASHAELARQLRELEQKTETRFEAVFQVLKDLMAPADTGRRRIGFRAGEQE